MKPFEPKWTAGPWRVELKGQVNIMAQENSYVATISGDDDPQWWEQTLADARLVAAAPDLHAALRAMYDAATYQCACGAMESVRPEADRLFGEAIELASVALSKAEDRDTIKGDPSRPVDTDAMEPPTDA